MTIQHEPQHTGEHILSEANGNRSREQIVLAAGNLPAGTVLALDENGDYVQLNPTGDTPTNVAAAVLYSATDASEAPARAVIHARDCEAIATLLNWPAGITEPQKATATEQLTATGIILR